MWIVMTSAARMPSSCKGRYRNVAVVRLSPAFAKAGMMPRMISTRARGVEAVRHLGHHNVGTTLRCAYERALQEAEALARKLNKRARPTPHVRV